MSSISVFSIVSAALFVVWAVLVWVFGGEKYMKWFFQFRHVNLYDIRKFKIVHILFLLLAAGCLLLIGFCKSEYRFAVLMVFILSSILQHILIHTLCKKK